MADEDEEERIDLPSDIPGRCFSCGLLGAWSTERKHAGIAGTSPVYEVGVGARQTGRLWQAEVDGETVETLPLCIRHRQDFLDDLLAIKGEPSAQTRALLSKNRGCEVWHQYTPYFSPKEHLEEARMLEIERMRREQTEIMTKVMEDHKEITEKLATINSDQAAGDQRQENSNRRFNILFVGIGLIAVVLALTPLAYPDGIAWVVDNAPGAINPQVEQQAVATVESQPSPVAVELTPTLSPGLTPDTASPQPQSEP